MKPGHNVVHEKARDAALGMEQTAVCRDNHERHAEILAGGDMLKGSVPLKLRHGPDRDKSPTPDNVVYALLCSPTAPHCDCSESPYPLSRPPSPLDQPTNRYDTRSGQDQHAGIEGVGAHLIPLPNLSSKSCPSAVPDEGDGKLTTELSMTRTGAPLP